MKTFKHSGDMGDIIYSLPTIRSLGGGILYLDINNSIADHFTKKYFDILRPLILSQPYIQEVQIWSGEPINHNLDLFRTNASGKQVDLSFFNLCEAHLDRFNLDKNLKDEQWLFVDFPLKYEEEFRTIIFARSARYHNNDFNWNTIVNEYGRSAFFVGIQSEYDDFIKQYNCKNIPFKETKDLLNLARYIAGSELFVGNQSCPYAIAEGMKKNTILEVCSYSPNCLFERPNARHHVYLK